MRVSRGLLYLPKGSLVKILLNLKPGISPLINHLLSHNSQLSNFQQHRNIFNTTLRFCSQSDTAVSTDPVLPEFSSLPESYLSVAFYQFTNLTTEQLHELQPRLMKELHKLGVVGRIYIAEEGINAQCSVPESRWQEFQDFFNNQGENTTQPFPLPFRAFNFNLGTEHSYAFAKLRVKIRSQIVATDIPSSDYDVSDSPTLLEPEEWHNKLVELKKAGVKPKLFDVRNAYEHAVGHFEGASLPDVATFRAGMEQLLTEVKELKKDEEILMYCTGGIRCSKAGAILKSRGYSNVQMLKGGITAYGNYIKTLDKDTKSLGDKSTNSIFHGKNFTFDQRLGETISEEIISKCAQCAKPTARYTNCVNVLCNLLFIQCPECSTKFRGTCGEFFCMDSPVLSRKDNINRTAAIHDHRDRVLPEFKSENLSA